MISESTQRPRKRSGVLPDGWERVRLTTVAQLESGHTPSRRMPHYWNGAIPWISLHDSNALDGREIFATRWTITEEGVANSSARLLPKGTVVFSRTATVGKATVMGRPMATSQDFANYVCGPKVHNHYLVHLFRFMAPDWKRVMAGSIHNTIYMPVFKKLEVNLPPVGEQQVIASSLHDIDRLLQELESLIAKKRDLKQAAMQQLLTGRVRLAGYGREWKQASLGELFTFKNGLSKAKQFFGFGTPIVNYMDVYKDPKIRASCVEGRVSLSVDEIKNFEVRRGDVLFTRTSETPEEVGLAAAVLDEPSQVVFSGFVLRARPRNDELCDEFKAYCFRSSFVRGQIISKATYTTRALTNGRQLSGVTLPIPPKSEQAAIAAVLSSLDDELAALKFRREKTVALKKAMMQQLLTGRIRLI